MSTNPHVPTPLDRRVRISCPGGEVLGTIIEFENGEPLLNVLRAVISLESPVAKGAKGRQPDGKAYVFLTQFDTVLGQVVYHTAEALIGTGESENEPVEVTPSS